MQSNTQFYTCAPAHARTDTHEKHYSHPICDLSAAVQECVDSLQAAVRSHQRTDSEDDPPNSHSLRLFSAQHGEGELGHVND